MFGLEKIFRKKTELESRKAFRGHKDLLARLKIEELEKPDQRALLVAHVIFESVVRVCKSALAKPGTRIDDVLAVLGSIGGHSCLLAAQGEAKLPNYSSVNQDFLEVKAKNGTTYHYGNLQNKYLIEGQFSFLNVAASVVHDPNLVSSLPEDVDKIMQHVADTLGTDKFGIPVLPAANMPSMNPIQFLKMLCPKVLDELFLYDVPITDGPKVLGLAVREAVTAGASVLKPEMALKIVLECSIPMSKLSSDYVANRK